MLRHHKAKGGISDPIHGREADDRLWSVCQKLMRPGCPLDLCCLSQRVSMPASCGTSAKGSLVRPQACQVALHSSLRAIVPDYLVASLGKDLGNPNYPATPAPTGRCRMLYAST